MSASSYDEALSRLLAHEGGYSNHPADPGGPTNYGITLADARAYWKRDATAADVRAMPLAVAKQIYRTKYWTALRGNDLPAGVDYAVFDYGVNSGIGRAGKVLRRLVGQSSSSITADATGAIDDAVIAAVWRRAPKRLIEAICDERLAFLQSLKTWPVFGNGWGRRVREVRAAALDMVDRAAASASNLDREDNGANSRGRTPSPHPNSGLPEFGTLDGRSRKHPTSAGEGGGEGVTNPEAASQTPPPPPPPSPASPAAASLRDRIASLIARLFHHHNQKQGV